MAYPPADERSLRVLHLALCVGCALFLVVLQVLRVQGVVPLAHGEFDVLALAAGVLLPGCALAIWNFNRMVARIPQYPPGQPQLLALRTALVLQWAAIEAVVMFGAVAYMLTGRWTAYAAAIAALVVLVLRAPTATRMDAWRNGLSA